MGRKTERHGQEMDRTEEPGGWLHGSCHLYIIILIMIIMIAFKGAVRDFLQSPCCAANRLQHVRSGPRRNLVQITCNTSSAYHLERVMCHLVRVDSSAIKFDRVEMAFYLSVTCMYTGKSGTCSGHRRLRYRRSFWVLGPPRWPCG